MWTALTIGIIAVLAIVAVGIWVCVPKKKETFPFKYTPTTMPFNSLSIRMPYDREVLNAWFAKYDEVMRIERLAKLKEGMFRDLVAMKDRSGLAIMDEDQ